jgi:hypothetical protein
MNKILPEEFPEMEQISKDGSLIQKDRVDNLMRLRRLRPIDDTFMRFIFRDNISFMQTRLIKVTILSAS